MLFLCDVADDVVVLSPSAFHAFGLIEGRGVPGEQIGLVRRKDGHQQKLAAGCRDTGNEVVQIFPVGSERDIFLAIHIVGAHHEDSEVGVVGEAVGVYALKEVGGIVATDCRR